MPINYKPLWDKLESLKVYKSDIAKKCNISPNTISRMGKGLPVSLDVIERLCKELDCKIEDIVEINN